MVVYILKEVAIFFSSWDPVLGLSWVETFKMSHVVENLSADELYAVSDLCTLLLELILKSPISDLQITLLNRKRGTFL